MTLYLLSDKIDSHLAEFCGSPVSLASRDFIATLSEDFMSDHCPDVLNLPGSLVALNNSDEAFVTIHLSGDTRSILERAGGAPSLLGTEDGLSAALILIEEISHFHHFVERATNSLSISRFDLEVLAEVEKVAVCSLLLEESFGHNHIHQVIHKVFNESNFHGSITNYKLASKTAERFWKKSVLKYGSGLLRDLSFRNQLKLISKAPGAPESRITEVLEAA